MEDHVWLGPSLERIAGLLAMPDRHNSYGCRKVTAHAAHGAVRMLILHMRPWTPAPRIMPAADGGLELEWHGDGVDFGFRCGPGPAPPGTGTVPEAETEKNFEECMTRLDAVLRGAAPCGGA